MSTTKPTHAPQTQFSIIDGCLHIGGMSLTALAQHVGKTPFYAYDHNLLTARVQHVRHHLPEEIGLHYSIKANPMAALVQHMAGLVDGFDVASGGELQTALDTRMDVAHISFTGPGKSTADLEHAIAAGVLVNLESESELNRIARIADATGIAPRIAVRVNPDFELKSSGMKMGGGPKPFGVDAEQVPQLLKQIGNLNLDFQGFHIFSGSQSLKPDAIIEAESSTFELAMRLAEHAPQPMRLLNIGGGFGIPYFPGERALDLGPIGDNLAQWHARIRAALPDVKVVLELGRYLVGEAGIYVARVVDRKISRGKIFLVVDGGLNHHLAASGNFGQVIRKNYPVAVGNKMSDSALENVSVVGPLCTPLDLLADSMDMARAEIGDLIVIFQSGAYGLAASPTAFLGHPAPAEVLV
ncbi:MAG TPA: pyridoxal-dependent decarboxylase, exosortase A system-associated [Burkholderiaceae bacterium]|jgi:diaminopimelate decarboxylase